MCKSVRGAAFFGSSLHLALSFVFLFWFIFDSLISEINIALWKCDPPEQKFRDIDPLAHYLNIVFKLMYYIALCVTGIYIFRGVERERPQLLKYAALAFVILQVVGAILFSVFFSIQWNTEPDLPPQLPKPASLIAESEPLPLEPGNCCNRNLEVIAPTELNTVTPLMNESVLPKPELNDTTTTPIPAPAPVLSSNATTTTTTTTLPPAIISVIGDNNNGSTTTTRSTEVPMVVTVPVPAPEPRRRLPHNQLVSLVLQMCVAVANGIGSVAYVIVLALYMLKL